MKKIILFISIISLSSFCSAQNNKIGISLYGGIPIQDPKFVYNYLWIDQTYNTTHRNSFFSGITANYNYTDTIAFRFSFGITSLYIHSEYDYYIPNNHQGIYMSKYQQSNINLAPGIIGGIKGKRIRFYGGCEIPFTLLGKSTGTSNGVEVSLVSGDTTSTAINVYTSPEGYSVGVGGILGFSFFPLKKFSIDLEYSPSLLYTSTKGKYTISQETTSPYGSNMSFVSDYNYQGFFFDQRFSIGLTYWFGCKKKNKTDDKSMLK